MGEPAISGTFRNEIITPNFISPSVDGYLPNAGIDQILARGGNDRVSGGGGTDTAKLGTGNDIYIWRAGDGEDTVFGQAGQDRFLMLGSSADELFLLTKGDGTDVRAINAAALEQSTLTGIETLIARPLGGMDQVDVMSLAGTQVKKVIVDLTEPAAEAAEDQVSVEGTGARNVISLTEANGVTSVNGLSAKVLITHAGGGDMLSVKGYGGNDRIDASAIRTNALKLDLEGGEGQDTLIGSIRADLLQGDAHSDLLIGGKGGDILDGGDGSDTLRGGLGPDQFYFTSTLGAGGLDTIGGFQPGIDKILLGSAFSAIGATLDAGEFSTGGPAAGVYVYHDLATGRISYDANGDGNTVDAVAFAKVKAGLALSASDFDVLV